MKEPEKIVGLRDFNSARSYFTHSLLVPVLGPEWLKQETEGTEAVLSNSMMSHSTGAQTMKNYAWAHETWTEESVFMKKFLVK